MASNTAYFSFLQSCGSRCRVIQGDARLTLAAGPPAVYDLLILDAFSSDAIPMHLLTAEALQMYLDKLKPSGALALHISNRHLDLEPVVSQLATRLALEGIARFDTDAASPGDGAGGDARPASGKQRSHWAVLARPGTTTLAAMRGLPGWRPLVGPAGAPLWTDSFSSIFGIIRWR
jgi:hypothetical protein